MTLKGINTKFFRTGILICIVQLAYFTHVAAKTTEYALTVDQRVVDITGKSVKKITVNGAIPAPVLHFTEGDHAIIHVTNNLKEATSIHWHGLLLPDEMDGVPAFGGYKEIPPGQTFVYRFKIRQSGTYWYHSHTKGQEQDGLYGAIVIAPKGKDPVSADRDYVVVLSDFTPEHSSQIMANLKKSSDYYANAQLTLHDFLKDVKNRGYNKAFKDAKNWGNMRMMRTDLADVTGYTFLMNGHTSQQNWTGLFNLGNKVRLRFINASAMSFFDVRIPGLKMRVVQSDGQNVEPVIVDEFRFAPSETYDVVVTPTEDKAYSVVAEPIDRSGFAVGTLATTTGAKGEFPQQRPRALLSMADMNMDLMMQDDPDMEMTPADMISGWGKTGMPDGHKALSYSDLRYQGVQKDQRNPQRTIDVRLGGNMERYIWTINDKKFSDAAPIRLVYGERVRLKFTNETMMAHPMHLHGMFVQLENGQPAAKLPNKHSVIVPPGGAYSVLVTADEIGEWAFHCHLLYHMTSGMMRQVIVAKLDPSDTPMSVKESSRGHNAH